MTEPTSKGLDLVWGCAAIAALLGVTERQAYGMLEAGQIPATKVGARWCVSRKKLQRHFEGEAA